MIVQILQALLKPSLPEVHATRKPKLLGEARWVRSNPLAGQWVTFFRPPKGRPSLQNAESCSLLY